MFDIGVFINEERLILTDKGISALKRQGVNKIGLAWELLISREGDENPRFKEIAEGLHGSCMDIYTVTTPRGWGNQPFSITNQDEGQRDVLLNWMQKLIRIAGQSGARIIPVYTSGACLPYSEEKCTKAALDFIGQLVPCAEDAGVKLALVNSYYALGENDGQVSCEVRFLIDSAQRLYDLAAEIKSPHVGICFDTGVSNMKRTALEDMHLLKDYIIHFYLSDTMKKQKNMLQPGYGNVPWVGLGRIIKEMNYTFPVFVNAPSYGGADFSKVITETQALLDGKVYTRPDGGIIGKDQVSGRIIIRA